METDDLHCLYLIVNLFPVWICVDFTFIVNTNLNKICWFCNKCLNFMREHLIVRRRMHVLFMLWFVCLSGKKARSKAPRIQRLVTPLVLQRKRHRLALKKRRSTKKREDAADYQKLLAQRLKEAKERKLERRRTASHSKSSVSRESQSSAGKK